MRPSGGSLLDGLRRGIGQLGPVRPPVLNQLLACYPAAAELLNTHCPLGWDRLLSRRPVRHHGLTNPKVASQSRRPSAFFKKPCL